MKLSSKALACGQSPMRKFHPYAVAAAAAGKKIYHLNIGQPDIHTPDALYDAIHNFRTPVLAYAASPGIPELIEAIERYYRNIGVQLNESDILITTGGSEALQIAANCLLDEGDEVIVPEPFYPNYHTFITTAGGVIHPLHTKPEEGYFYADRARIEACITPKTKAIMITNPGNPTGTCLTEAQMKMLLDVAVAHDLYLVADEVYREFTYDGEPLHSFGKFDYGQENLILIDSVSKRFSACGARIGCLISRNREFMANALKYCQARLSVATLDQIAAAALYSVGPEYFEQVRQEYKRRRDTVVRKLHEIPGVICECRAVRFISWPRCRSTTRRNSSSGCCRSLKIAATRSCSLPESRSMPRPARAATKSASPTSSSRRIWSAPWTFWPSASVNTTKRIENLQKRPVCHKTGGALHCPQYADKHKKQPAGGGRLRRWIQTQYSIAGCVAQEKNTSSRKFRLAPQEAAFSRVLSS